MCGCCCLLFGRLAAFCVFYGILSIVANTKHKRTQSTGQVRTIWFVKFWPCLAIAIAWISLASQYSSTLEYGYGIYTCTHTAGITLAPLACESICFRIGTAPGTSTTGAAGTGVLKCGVAPFESLSTNPAFLHLSAKIFLVVWLAALTALHYVNIETGKTQQSRQGCLVVPSFYRNYRSTQHAPHFEKRANLHQTRYRGGHPRRWQVMRRFQVRFAIYSFS